MKKVFAAFVAFVLCFACLGCESFSRKNPEESGGQIECPADPDDGQGAGGDNESGDNEGGGNIGEGGGDDGDEKEPPATEPPSEPYTKVVVLAGQSNALGCTYFDNLTAAKIGAERYARVSGEFGSVKILNGKNAASLEDFEPVAAGQGLSAAQSNGGRLCFGPELGMAETLSEAYGDETVYIIKFAVGGSSLFRDWITRSRGAESYNTVCLNAAVKSGLEVLEAAELNPKIVGFCWMQGEADGTHIYYDYGDGKVGDSWSRAYYDNFVKFSSDMRADYAEYALGEKMNIIDAYISDCSSWQYYRTINDAKLAFSRLEGHNYLLDTRAPSLMRPGVNGLIYSEEEGDPLHFDSESMLKLGNMFGEQISAICGA